MKMIPVLSAALAALSLAGTAVVAQRAPDVKTICAADRQKLCPGIDDVRAARRCMRNHMDSVSPDCHAAMKAAQAAYAARKARAAAAASAAPAGGPPPATPH